MQDLDYMYPKDSISNFDDSLLLINESKIENFELSPPTKKRTTPTFEQKLGFQNCTSSRLTIIAAAIFMLENIIL